MGTRAPDPDESVAALAAQVRDLRGELTGLKARVGAAGSKTNLRLAQQVAELAATVKEWTDSGDAPVVAAPVWHDLTQRQHDAQVEILTGWVDGFLRVHYPHVTLRPCWAGHPACLWELSTLRAEWIRVYERKHPELAGALQWHDRYLPATAVRLAAILKDCKRECGLRSPVRSLPQPQAG